LSVGYQYTFGARGQLTSTTDPNGHTTTLTINDDDQLVRVTDPAPFSYQQDFYHDANVDENGVLDTYTYHTDEQGNVRALTDPSGAVVERYAYDDWGNPSFFTGAGAPLPSSTAGNFFLYRGMLWEPPTQLYRIGASAYDPHIGRPIRCPSGRWHETRLRVTIDGR
jgi:YD repeat-containing protein